MSAHETEKIARQAVLVNFKSLYTVTGRTLKNLAASFVVFYPEFSGLNVSVQPYGYRFTVNLWGSDSVPMRACDTTRVFPDAEGVGFSKSISIQSLLFFISTVMAIVGSPWIKSGFGLAWYQVLFHF